MAEDEGLYDDVAALDFPGQLIGSGVVTGDISHFDDIDLFRVNLTAGTLFSVLITPGIEHQDLALVLMRSDGSGFYFGGLGLLPVAANAYFGGNQPLVYLPDQTTTYYLGVSSTLMEAVDHVGNPLRLWETYFDHWQTGQSWQDGAYELTISGASPVPVPAAAWLFGAGLTGLVSMARRRRAG